MVFLVLLGPPVENSTHLCLCLPHLQPELQCLPPFPIAGFRIKGAWTIVFSVFIHFDNVVFILYLEVFSAMVISFPDIFLRNSKTIVGNSDVQDLSRFDNITGGNICFKTDNYKR